MMQRGTIETGGQADNETGGKKMAHESQYIRGEPVMHGCGSCLGYARKPAPKEIGATLNCIFCGKTYFSGTGNLTIMASEGIEVHYG